LKVKCYFCQKEAEKINNYYGCLHFYRKYGKIFVRHLYTKDAETGKPQDLLQLLWTFRYKRRTYEMLYMFLPHHTAALYRCKSGRELIASFQFIPNWTPENCQEKLSKVLAFA